MPPRRSAQPPPPRDVRQFRSTSEVDHAIRKLRTRITEIQALISQGVSRTDARVKNVQDAIRDTIREEFGADSAEHERHRYFEIDDSPRTIRSDYMGGGHWEPADADVRRFAERAPTAITRIQGLIQRLEEKRADFEEPAAVSRVAFSGAALHPAIASAAQSLFDSGHHAAAVFEAGKALVALVKAKSGSSLDGAALMQNVFSVNNPVLAFNGQADQSDRDEQLGLMHLYTGAVLAIRNPGGHRVGAVEGPARALQHLQLLSYLAERLDAAKKL